MKCATASWANQIEREPPVSGGGFSHSYGLPRRLVAQLAESLGAPDLALTDDEITHMNEVSRSF